MSDLSTVLATMGDTRLSPGALLAWLHQSGRLRPLLREALVGAFVQQQAREAGLSTTTEERQAAADAFRRRLGLHSASATHAWLAEQGLSVDDFEGALERDLLAARLREHITSGRVARQFAEHKAEYERLKLARLVVPRDDLARELASQIRDEGRSLAALAHEQGLALSEGVVFLGELASPLREGVASAGNGELIGPVATPAGFVLLAVEERYPPELDARTRGCIQDTLYAAWLDAQVRTICFAPVPAGGA